MMQTPLFQVEKEGKRLQLNFRDFETLMQVKPLLSLRFDQPKYFEWLVRKCKKALKQGWITEEQIWLGTYYEKEIQEEKIPDITIRWINSIKGYGVFTNRALRKKTYIGEYTGLLRKRKKRLDRTNSYCFEYIIGEGLDTPFTIDAKDQGNHVRFINHHSMGNLDPMLVFSGGIMHVILYTNRAVEAGEELTYDYGEDYWAKREQPVL